MTTKIPYRNLLGKMVDYTFSILGSGNSQYLGSSLRISGNNVELALLLMKDEYLGIGREVKIKVKGTFDEYINYTHIIDLTLLRIGKIELANPTSEALMLVVDKVDRKELGKLKTILVKTAIGVSNFITQSARATESC